MKKKMMYGGKVKKMAVGGTTRTQSKIKDLGPNKGTKRIKGRRLVDVMTDKIFELVKSKANASPAQIIEINKRIAEKRAGIEANAPVKPRTRIKDLGPNKGTKRVTKDEKMGPGAIAAAMDFPNTRISKGVKYDTKSTIPTKTGTDKDTKTKYEMGIEARDLLNKEKRREKKAGGTIKKKAGGKVKKMMGGGMAKKYKHGGSVKKCKVDGIAKRGRTRAARKK